LDFFVVDPISVFLTVTFFVAEQGSDERGKISPLVTPQSAKNFTSMMIRIEKINRPFTTEISECALIRCFATPLCRKRRILQNIEDYVQKPGKIFVRE
jgi:hypothetical protein